MSEERNAIPLIITGICTIIGTVGALWYYGYLHFAKPQDALLLNDFTMLKTIPGEDYKISLTPANQVAQCVDGIIVLVRHRAKRPDRGAGEQQEASRSLHGPGNPETATLSTTSVNAPDTRSKKPRLITQAGLLFLRVQTYCIDERGATGWLSLEMVTSTRRFWARPELVALLATGYSLP
jgi:hypothetical protein